MNMEESTALPSPVSKDSQQLRRLVIWNRIWIGLAVLLTLSLAGRWVDQQIFTEIHKLHITWTAQGDLDFSSLSDGPFIVTHLVKVQPIEPTPSVAELPIPIVIIDSAGAILKKSDFESLSWFSYLHEPHPAPIAGTQVIAFYYRPLRTGPTLERFSVNTGPTEISK